MVMLCRSRLETVMLGQVLYCNGRIIVKKLCCGHGIHKHPVVPGCRKQVTQ